MPNLVRKYQPVSYLAQALGCTKVEVQIGGNRFVMSALCPSQLIADLLWAKVNEINPQLADGDLTLHLSVQRSDIYGHYTIQPGDTLVGIIQKVSHGRLSSQRLIEANRSWLCETMRLEVGRQLTIPNF